MNLVQLVNKDQLDIVSELRASVSQEKDSLTSECNQLREEVLLLKEGAHTQTLQINKLLLDKIEMQGDSLDQRQKMVERERDLS